MEKDNRERYKENGKNQERSRKDSCGQESMEGSGISLMDHRTRRGQVGSTFTSTNFSNIGRQSE